MSRPLALLAAMAATTLAATTAADPVATLAGRYSRHWLNRLMDGTEFPVDDVVEIVPVDPRHAYLRAELNFGNGHTCSLTGIATAEGDALVYHGLRDDTNPAGKVCTLRLSHRGRALGWTDGGSCQQHCGARGDLDGGELAWASRRPITYLSRLKGSAQYRAALAEWRTGKPAR